MQAVPPLVLKALREHPFQLLDLAKKLPDGQYSQRLHPSARSIHEILVHMLDAEEFWVRHVLQGGPRTHRDPAALPTPDALERTWRPIREETVAYLQSLKEDDLTRPVPLPWNPTSSRTVQEILWHLVTHEFHHKGQVCTRLAMAGVQVPDLDVISREE